MEEVEKEEAAKQIVKIIIASGLVRQETENTLKNIMFEDAHVKAPSVL